MFNMESIGQKICNARKNLNMTQMELADKLNISFQAISNWERGQSCPDISKLPEICNILNISIDELFGKNKIIKNIVNENLDDYLKTEKININELKEVAPILKPTQSDAILESFEENLSISDLVGFAPFLSNDFLYNMIIKFYKSNKTDITSLNVFAPFLSNEQLNNFILEVVKNSNTKIQDLTCFAPFINKNNLFEIITYFYENKRINNIDELSCFAPFLAKEDLTKLINQILDDGNVKNINDLMSFMPFINANEIVEKLIKNKF